MREGSRSAAAALLLDGWAYRYCTLEDGRRQITGLLLPGDLWGVDQHLLGRTDFSIAAVTALTYAELPHDRLTQLALDRPRIGNALRRELLVAGSIARQWIVNVGQRTAFERLGHLLCELFFRLRAIGLADSATCPLPLTQADLAEALGITSVHANRVVQELRAAGLIHLENRQLTVPNLDALCDASMFDPSYLHLGDGLRHDRGNP